ncbi:hypothetical protein [Desulfopila sp. IMCC35008]|uniref:hypothetical protein n=1 Tax=Desulfopila sp. IMCC35008 TaxID=2653858 RepID=UPI0013D13929|nr:hypothetical protein [Desulfopila sp. IMCC35008]
MLRKSISCTAIAISFTLLLLSGCSSTKLVTSWSDKSFSGPPIQKVLVVGVMKNDIQRKMYESQFVARINEGGITGIPAYTIIPDSVKPYSEEAIRKAVAETGVDAAIIACLADIEKKQRYVPPTYEYEPMFGRRHGFNSYYGRSYRYVSTPGYTTTDTIVKLETTVFATSSGKMIWAGATRSFNPSSAEGIVKKNADLIIKDMRDSGLLK